MKKGVRDISNTAIFYIKEYKILIILALIIITSLHMCYRPFNWKISKSEVKYITLNGKLIDEAMIPEMVKTYNKSYGIKPRHNTEGATPEYVAEIVLKSGDKIDIQNCSYTYFIIDRKSSTKYKSYWANNKRMFNLMKEEQDKKTK